MSNFADGFTAPTNPLEEDQNWAATLGVLYPNLAHALMGDGPDKKNGARMPGMSLIVSKKNGALRFILSSPECSRTYFGPQIDANDVLGSIEQALTDNAGEWSTKRDNGTGHRR